MKNVESIACQGLLVLLALGLLGSGLVSCAEETTETGNPIPIETEENQEEEEEEEEEGYTAGVLDGRWELFFANNDEVFAELTVEHDLDEQVLRIAYYTPDYAEEGTVPTSAWQNETFTAQWVPYEGQEYTITQSSFVEESTDRLEGMMRATTFDFRPFVMMRIE